MRVLAFNPEKGFYHFQMEELETELHSHPVIEILYAESGTFELTSANQTYQNLCFAIVDANVLHGVSGKSCVLNTLMIEHHNALVRDLLSEFELWLENGLCINQKKIDSTPLVQQIVEQVSQASKGKEYDARVRTIIEYLQKNELEYQQMITTLEELVHLSRSRISHIFKSNIGISLKKYLLWEKLKSTIQLHLNEEEDLFTSLIQSGFYDQPHFSKAFKHMFGVKPTAAYNSRIIQDFPPTPS